MTSDQITGAVVRWIAAATGLTVVRAYQAGDRPARPYIAVHLRSRDAVQEHPARTRHDVASGTGNTTAHPEIDTEFEFAVTVYGGSAPERPLEILKARSLVPEFMEPLWPAIAVHDVGAISNAPEIIGNTYEARATAVLRVRAVVDDGAAMTPVDSFAAPTITRA